MIDSKGELPMANYEDMKGHIKELIGRWKWFETHDGKFSGPVHFSFRQLSGPGSFYDLFARGVLFDANGDSVQMAMFVSEAKGRWGPLLKDWKR